MPQMAAEFLSKLMNGEEIVNGKTPAQLGDGETIGNAKDLLPDGSTRVSEIHQRDSAEH